MSIFRFNLAVPGGDPQQLSERYRAMLEMASYAEQRGLTAINVEEHHTPDDGWGPSPLVAAGLLAGRTTTLQILVSAFIAPLYDPVRLAKDLAVLDLASGGRVRAVAALGYRREEYDLFGVDFERRGEIMDESVATILAAWRGEELEHGGRRVVVSPRPMSPPMALLMIGGARRPAARRAARNGLGFLMNSHAPDVRDYYLRLCAEHGTTPFVMMPEDDSGVLLLSADPDRAWATVGENLLYEAMRYGEWNRRMAAAPPNYSRATSVEELREEGVYRILTPAQAAEELRRTGGALVVHPMCGGITPEQGWETVRLAVDEVLRMLSEN